MAKKPEPKTNPEKPVEATSPQTLGDYLASIRAIRKLKLRDVEEATNKEVSNGYLSQLETNKITKPSPHVLHALAKAYVIPYETLMQKAGYLPASTSPAPQVLRSASTPQHGRVPTFANEPLTQEEEESLLEYLAFLRSRRGKSGKSQ
ncbi:helix-turn-helix domain-containing protein [Lacipirellula parvula]|uniref:HTH cro/C1-type domain-containing protein n=1 Tax=Lacipirellula parvula TaxID=2650471 RepID=A0A5K7XIL4_9BACT|nr:helix-turn-helix transcriptional regulator [Lacipirellula parvula]BBO34176.1 hypothetical protein PLANPX_3788 [Lacipirellula parvula]